MLNKHNYIGSNIDFTINLIIIGTIFEINNAFLINDFIINIFKKTICFLW